MAESPIVIVGGGLAGAKAAEALREQGFAGPVVLVSEESDRPYERPPLSKGYLMGQDELDSVFVHPEDWYTANDVDLRLGVAVTMLDPAARRVELADGGALDYSAVLLATGSHSRRLPVPGADAENVLYLRRIGDSQRIKETIAASEHLLVVGGGWIGREVAAAARQAGVAVTLVEAAQLPLLGVLGPEAAQVFADLHAEQGVTLRVGLTVDHFDVENGRAIGATLSDGSRVDADAVVVGVGASPNTRLAEEAGVPVDDGVLVDAGLRSKVPHVFAAGDIAKAEHPTLNRRVRVEHWANALNQPAVAATSMMGGEASYDRLPYFYTDQYDLGMEYRGYVEPGESDQVVFRGDRDTGEFVVFWVGQGRVLAGMNVNVWDVGDQVEELIRSGTSVDVARLSDPAVPLTDVAAG